MKTLTALFILFAGLGAGAQTKISGLVADQSGNALPGANIYIENTYDGTSSNLNGVFEFTTNEFGKVVLVADFIGFEQQTIEVQLNGQTVSCKFRLNEAFNQLDAVDITANAFEAGDKKKSIAMTPLDMVTTPSATGDIYGALQSLPGTTTVGESGKLYVKGGDSRESKTFVDGTLVYAPYSSAAPNTAVRGRFNPFMFSGTTFSTGAYSAEYGQALSGVLSLKTNEMPVEDQLNVTLISAGGGVAGTKTFDKSSITASANYYNLKPYMQLVPQYTKWNNEPVGANTELSYRLKTKNSGMFKFYTQLNYGNMAMHQVSSESQHSYNNFELLNNNAFINTSWIGDLGNNWILSTGISFTKNNDYISLDTANYNEYLSGGHSKLMVSKKVSDKIKIKLGSEFYTKQFKTEFLAQADSIFNGFTNNMAAAFAESDIYTSTKFVTRMGVRFEYSYYLHRFNIAPRLSTAYKFNKESQISLAYGWFFQDADDAYLIYTNHLNFERANHYTMNYQYEKNQRILRSELFYKDYSSLLKFTDQPFYKPEGYNNKGYGYAYGFDIFYRDNKTIKNGQYWISYSYIQSEKDYLDFSELSSPKYASKHNINVVYKQWIATLRSQFGASYKFASPRVYNNPNTSQFNDEKTLAYQSLDLNWSYLFRQHVIFYASVSNLPGFKQQFGNVYSKTTNAEGVYTATPILPGSKRFFLVACFITLSRKGDINQLDKIN